MTEKKEGGGIFITCDSRLSYVFWVDCCEPPHIGRIGMDGRGQTVIVDTEIYSPTALTIDYTNKRIYWADDNHILLASMDGTQRRKGESAVLFGVVLTALTDDRMLKIERFWFRSKTPSDKLLFLFFVVRDLSRAMGKRVLYAGLLDGWLCMKALRLNTFSYVAPHSLIINHVLYYLVLFLDKVQISQVNYTVNNCFQTQSSV